MKKLLYLLFLLFLGNLQMALGNGIKHVNLNYDLNDFPIEQDTTGLVTISTFKYPAVYGTEVGTPALPWISVNIAIPKDVDFEDIEVKAEKCLLKGNADLSVVSYPVPTNQLPVHDMAYVSSYNGESYPSKNIEYVGSCRMGEYTILNFIVCPFMYETKVRSLSFINKMSLSVYYKETAKAKQLKSASSAFDYTRDIWLSLVVNPEDLEAVSTQNMTRLYSGNEGEKNLDYVIITSSELSSAYMPLVHWKMTKGVKADIMTIEDIQKKYEGKTLPIQIKKCLQELFSQKGLKYVLLGGDDTVVPVERCFGKVVLNKDSTHCDATIPTDLFYACFNGNFEWDANQNDTCGEVKDNIDMTPSLFVSRVPVRNQSDVEAFVYKLLSYEKSPILSGCNKILTVGNKILEYIDEKSDSEVKWDTIYKNYINPYWHGERVKFYDTCSEVTDDPTYKLNKEHLQEQLSKGFPFADVSMHGFQTGWNVKSFVPYEVKQATTLENLGHTIITTEACLTNAFDNGGVEIKNDPCLSEAFIRNPQSGVIAYLGCSREGWEVYGAYVGYSGLYNASFYKNLFSSILKEKKFGAIVAASKMAWLNHCKRDGSMRWIQFGLNPIGDPEMPIFIQNPKEFNIVNVTKEGQTIRVNTGVEDCNICLMSTDDEGKTYYQVEKGVQECHFLNVPENVSVCITKQDYIPYLISINDNDVSIQNETIHGNHTYKTKNICIGSNVTNKKPQGEVLFKGGTIEIQANTVTIEPETTISKGTEFIITK